MADGIGVRATAGHHLAATFRPTTQPGPHVSFLARQRTALDQHTDQPEKTPDRHDLCRSAPFSITRDESVNGDGLTLEGLAAVFNVLTVIDSWEGRFKEQLAPGSFKKTLRERTPKLQFDHGRHPLIGSIPIGRINEAREDGDVGVRVKARLSDNWLVQPVREGISSGTIDGMSFRFDVTREEWVDQDGKKMTPDQVFQRLFMSDEDWDAEEDQLMTRTIKELSCAELGPVVFPQYTETTVGVRSITIDLGQLDRPEQRSQLAQAILLADLAERSGTEVGESAPPVLDGHPGEATTEAAAPPTDVEHPASRNAAPPADAEHPAATSATPDDPDTPDPGSDLAVRLLARWDVVQAHQSERTAP